MRGQGTWDRIWEGEAPAEPNLSANREVGKSAGREWNGRNGGGQCSHTAEKFGYSGQQRLQLNDRRPQEAMLPNFRLPRPALSTQHIFAHLRACTHLG